MKLYKVQIELCSPLITPLKGDTIWGHVVWGIANHEGDEKVKEFLEKEKESPAFVISSAFPTGTVCKPQVKPTKRIAGMDKTKYAEIKENKKKHYMAASDLFENTESVNTQKIGKIFAQSHEMHNSINRVTNTVEDDGSLFSVNTLWSSHSFFDIYIASVYSAKRVTELLAWAFENGYGADSSTGKGAIKIVHTATEVQVTQQGTVYMALAPFVLEDANEVENLRADIFMRAGKIGGQFVSELSPWKKTVILFDEGATFTSKKPITIIGKLLTDVHSDSRICQAGYAPVIPITMEV